MISLKIYAIILGVLLMPVAVDITTTARGYSALGGEYLLIPLFLLVAQIIEDARKF